MEEGGGEGGGEGGRRREKRVERRGRGSESLERERERPTAQQGLSSLASGRCIRTTGVQGEIQGKVTIHSGIYTWVNSPALPQPTDLARVWNGSGMGVVPRASPHGAGVRVGDDTGQPHPRVGGAVLPLILQRHQESRQVWRLQGGGISGSDTGWSALEELAGGGRGGQCIDK